VETQEEGKDDKYWSYKGQIKDGKRHGYGVTEYHGDYPNSHVEGHWALDKPDGHVKVFYKDSIVITYEGNAKQGRREGLGTMIWTNGSEYTGQFTDNKVHGDGCYLFPNGDKYEGEFSEHKITGYGKLTKSNGETFEGKYQNLKL